jgi:hypothetical protein
MVNQVLETSHRPSSPAPCLYVSVAALSSIFRTLFQVPYPATPLFATLMRFLHPERFYGTKTAGVRTQNSQSGTPLVLAGERTEMYSGGKFVRPRNNPRQILDGEEK